MKPLLLVFAFFLLISSCSKKNLKPSKICFTRAKTHLKIENNTNKTIYFAAFSQNILASIDWGPFCTNPGVAANSSVSKNLSTSIFYSKEDKLVVFWWECTANKAGEIQSLLLNQYQTICR